MIHIYLAPATTGECNFGGVTYDDLLGCNITISDILGKL
jgi:hypothetical protein